MILGISQRLTGLFKIDPVQLGVLQPEEEPEVGQGTNRDEFLTAIADNQTFLKLCGTAHRGAKIAVDVDWRKERGTIDAVKQILIVNDIIEWVRLRPCHDRGPYS